MYVEMKTDFKTSVDQNRVKVWKTLLLMIPVCSKL